MKTMRFFLGVCLMILLASSFAFSTDYQSAASADWNTSTTWSPVGIPTATDNVTILTGHIVSLAAPGSCALLTINAGGKLTITAGGPLPGTSWALDPASTVEFNTVVPASWVNATFGNLIFNTPNYSLPTSITVNGDLTVLANTLRGIGTTSGTNTHTVAGNVILSGIGSRISGVNQGGANTASCTWNIGGSVTLSGNNAGNRIILYESGGPHSGSATFNINGNLSIGAASQVQFKSSSGTGVDYPAATINLKGNLVQNGPIGINSVTAGASPGLTLNFNGTSAQDWSGTGAFSVSAWTVAVKINNATGVTLSAPRTFNVNTSLTLTNGNLTTTGTNLLFVSDGIITGGGATSFVNGPLKHQVSVTTAATKPFPIGKGTAYRPIELTVTQDAATATTYTAEQITGAPPVRTLDLLERVSVVRYYTITKGTGAGVTAATVKLSYDTDDGVSDETTLRIAKDDGSGNWVDLGGTGTFPVSGTITSTNNFTAFSDFVLANTGSNPLPIQLAAFTASVFLNHNVRLAWETLSESNNLGFYIQKKAQTGSTWNEIENSFLPGHGTTSEPQHYSFVDNNVAGGAWQYRLRQVDLDGAVHFSESVQVDVVTSVNESAPLQFALLQNYPNPFNPSTEIRFSVAVTDRATIEIYNTLGQKIATLFDDIVQAGQYQTVRFSGDNLASGVYFYRLQSGTKTEMKKFMLMK